jgi:hypothetical protein
LTCVPGFEIERPHLHDSDRLLQAWNLRKTSLLRDRSNGDAVKASADKSAPLAASSSRIPANGELRRRAYARVRGECAPSRIFARAGLERSPLHDVRQHAPAGANPSRVRIDVLLDEPRRCRMQRRESTRTDARAQHERADNRTTSGLVEPDGIEPTTSCLQSRRSPN